MKKKEKQKKEHGVMSDNLFLRTFISEMKYGQWIVRHYNNFHSRLTANKKKVELLNLSRLPKYLAVRTGDHGRDKNPPRRR